ncbi:hypothetical protein [Actinomadura sp. GTD37]|uniref:hypothetical protein n=1 Tax=Actinomadura sp. GTD37 TaxID=1778030 RepID=UPI0035BFEF67
MRDALRSPLAWSRLPAARVLLLLLGMLGFVAGPVGAGAHGGASATGAISGVRPAQVAKAPVRSRSSTKPRTARHVQQVRERAVVAVARHAAGAAAPSAQPPHAALPASGADVPPPGGRLAPPAAAPLSPDLAPRAVPRGRAPPSPARI